MKAGLIFLIYSLCLNVYAKDNFSIYLVRHAEKQIQGDNPNLTPCGRFRAKQLVTLLEQTARPLANKNNLSIKHYNPKHLAEFALRIKQQKHNSLIVGHSNTTPILVELLTGKKVSKIAENNYQMLYQIQFSKKEIFLTVLKQPLTCNISS